MTPAWFVTGTDTEIGKTHATCALIHGFRAAGKRVAAMKPIAAGIEADGCNDDVRRLLAASGLELPAELVNPYLFAPPIAPHVAAADAGVRIDLGRLRQAADRLKQVSEVLLVEGVGGFRVPLDERVDSADLAVALGLPVILVVGLRLGCINHALLSVEAIENRGLILAGWIANSVDAAMLRPEASVEALRRRIAAPLLGSLPRLPDPVAAAAFLSLPRIGQPIDLQG